MPGAPAPPPADAQPLDEQEFTGRRWPLTPSTMRFHGRLERPWWIVGGWAVEAFTGVAREHDDLDISILSDDIEAFRLFLGDRYSPWTS